MKYLIVIEKTDTGFSAYSPDVMGYAASGKTKREVEAQMQEALEFHLQGLALDNEEIPRPHTYSNYVEVSTTAVDE